VKGVHDAWSIVYSVFNSIKAVALVVVIVLIGTGWSYLKPFLSDRDKQVILVVLVVQCIVNVSASVLDEMSPGDAMWLRLRDILHVLDLLCCCGILLPIVWSIRHLRSAVAPSDASSSSSSSGAAATVVSSSSARTLDKLQRFRKFYLLVVSYIYLTRIVVYLISSLIQWQYSWVPDVVAEVFAVVFYFTTGRLFQPESAYLLLEVDDDGDAGKSSSSSSRSGGVPSAVEDNAALLRGVNRERGGGAGADDPLFQVL
jgi:hypothetical protein